jgi:hypothetical protein
MSRLLVLLSLLMLAMSGACRASDSVSVSFSFSGCTDPHNQPVRSQEDPNLATLLETRLVEGNRVIFYNPTLFPELQPATRAFLYAHECAWTRLGLPVTVARTEANAHRADCWAVETLYRQKLIKDANALTDIEGDLALIAEQQAQLPQPARTLTLASCAAHPPTTTTKSTGNVVSIDASIPNSPAWNACMQSCGNRLYACGRSSACTSSFSQCTNSCSSK